MLATTRCEITSCSLLGDWAFHDAEAMHRGMKTYWRSAAWIKEVWAQDTISQRVHYAALPQCYACTLKSIDLNVREALFAPHVQHFYRVHGLSEDADC